MSTGLVMISWTKTFCGTLSLTMTSVAMSEITTRPNSIVPAIDPHRTGARPGQLFYGVFDRCPAIDYQQDYVGIMSETRIIGWPVTRSASISSGMAGSQGVPRILP